MRRFSVMKKESSITRDIKLQAEGLHKRLNALSKEAQKTEGQQGPTAAVSRIQRTQHAALLRQFQKVRRYTYLPTYLHLYLPTYSHQQFNGILLRWPFTIISCTIVVGSNVSLSFWSLLILNSSLVVLVVLWRLLKWWTTAGSEYVQDCRMWSEWPGHIWLPRPFGFHET